MHPTLACEQVLCSDAPHPVSPQVFYNTVDSSSIGVSSVASATSLTQYQYSTVITDPGAGYLGALLFPGDATAKAAVGFMQTFLLPIPGAWTGPLSFSVSAFIHQSMEVAPAYPDAHTRQPGVDPWPGPLA